MNAECIEVVATDDHPEDMLRRPVCAQTDGRELKGGERGQGVIAISILGVVRIRSVGAGIRVGADHSMWIRDGERTKQEHVAQAENHEVGAHTECQRCHGDQRKARSSG